jgi:hypothetical protein
MTAVEWLVNELKDNGIEYLDLAYEIIEQAKKMEKQQIIDAYIEGYSSNLNAGDSEKYYNETFGDVE